LLCFPGASSRCASGTPPSLASISLILRLSILTDGMSPCRSRDATQSDLSTDGQMSAARLRDVVLCLSRSPHNPTSLSLLFVISLLPTCYIPSIHTTPESFVVQWPVQRGDCWQFASGFNIISLFWICPRYGTTLLYTSPMKAFTEFTRDEG